MVTVTLADLAYRYRQFLIAVVGAGVVMAMALLMAGLVGGFGAETTDHRRGGRTMGARQRGRRTDAAVSVFPQAATAVIAPIPGCPVATLVLLPQQIAHTGTKACR